jgi:hypothetical protein
MRPTISSQYCSVKTPQSQRFCCFGTLGLSSSPGPTSSVGPGLLVEEPRAEIGRHLARVVHVKRVHVDDAGGQLRGSLAPPTIKPSTSGPPTLAPCIPGLGPRTSGPQALGPQALAPAACLLISCAALTPVLAMAPTPALGSSPGPWALGVRFLGFALRRRPRLPPRPYPPCPAAPSALAPCPRLPLAPPLD